MKKLFMAGGIAGLLAGLLWLISLANASVSASVVAQAPSVEFSRFPIDRAVSVSIDVDPAEFGALSERERRDQALDWLLLATLAQTNLNVADLNQATFDLPVARRNYLAQVANFEYGPTRSRMISGNRLLVLLPSTASAVERRHNLAAAFDEHRKNQGVAPREVIFFDYQLNFKESSATLARRTALPGSVLLSAEYGYREMEITSQPRLQEFLAQTNDVVFASLNNGSLVLGGRKLAPSQYVGFNVEGVATLWQSEHAIGEKQAAFKRVWDQKADAFNAQWRGDRTATQSQYDAGWAKLQAAHNQAQMSAGIVDHSGFSLDPEVDYPMLTLAFALSRPDMMSWAASKGRPLSEGELDRVLEGLRRNESGPLFALRRTLRSENTEGAQMVQEMLEQISSRAMFQHSRYDGELAGTEVGMVLFYTDLLAKLWALDFGGNASRGVIAGFQPMTQVKVSPVFLREVAEHNGTRLWFGHQDKGMQLAADGRNLLFARNATRIYAASSDLLEPGKESEPNAESQLFLGWWDDHYEEIASAERQYERLNQIMKWSAILAWLNAQGQEGALKFLADVHVDRSYWFPDWAARQAGLRYTDWSKVGFFDRGDRRSHTEALPLLKSASYTQFGRKNYVLSGGVSLAAKDTFAARKALSAEAPELLRRSMADYAGQSAGQMKFLSGAVHTFSSEAQTAKLISRAREGSKLRMAEGELAYGDLERTLRREANGLEIEAGVAGKSAGGLRIDADRSGLLVAWRNRELDGARLATKRASAAPDFAEALLNDREIAGLVRLPGADHYAFKLRDCEHWTEVLPETAESSHLASGWDGRVADSLAAVRRVQFRILPDGAALEKAGGGNLVLLKERSQRIVAPAKVELARLAPQEAPLLGSLKRGDMADAARKIAADPSGAARVLNERLKTDLALVDGLMAEGHMERAWGMLDELRALHGNLPDIQLRRGVALIERGKTARAAAAAQEMTSGPLRDGGAFLKELAGRAERHQGAQAANLDRWRAFAAWRNEQAGSKDAHGWLSMDEGATMTLSWHDDARLLQGAKSVDPASIPQGEHLIYVQHDLPGMNSVDWNLPLSSALHQLPDGTTAKVVKLDGISVAQYRPDVVYAGETVTQSKQAGSRMVAVQPRPVGGRPPCDQQAGGDTQQNCRRQEAPPVYVVLAAR